MAKAILIPGKLFRLYREPAPGDLDYVALATTLSFTTRTAVQEAATVGGRWIDQGAGPRSWSLAFSGRADTVAFRKIEADDASGQPCRYRIVLDAGEPRSYGGLIIFQALTRGMAERGFMTFEAECVGKGELVFT